ncbi:hypothetical protein [Chryseobacterium indoltheticum]|uniref:hypothetical protein n=1 Tax=Chryseobacterium indoltheticum TaxID=254 RepID=UPI0019131C78|nr:hypothetical protein [Chryseobacterium indoltheticum]QQQ30305.1 hypothetical protein JJL46_10040 [Chryseobacterium indoltheticum]
MKEIYFEIPLYKILKFTDSDEDQCNAVLSFINYRGLIDGYNPQLNENTSYQVIASNPTSYGYLSAYVGFIKRELKCVRTSYIITTYFLLEREIIESEEDDDISNYRFQKIGQFPTIADLEIGKYKKFSKLLSKENLRELNKAIGLSANGVGIGAFVYLRRIFENLIENYHEEARKKDNWNEEDYTNSRISERIELLKNFLPEAVVKYKKVYSIISKGIHELEEQECLTYFPIVKDAIIAILEQDYLVRENANKQKELEKSIQDLVEKLK